MGILRRGLSRIIAFLGSSNVLHARFIRINGYEARRQINECVARTTIFVGLLWSNFRKDSITSSTILQRCQGSLVRDVRYMFCHNDVSSRLQLRFTSFFRLNRTMTIMRGTRTLKVRVMRNSFVFGARCVNGRKTRFSNSWGRCFRTLFLLFISSFRLLTRTFFIGRLRCLFSRVKVRTTG